ncbi:MAG: DUF721 domain-containing protein [Rhodocyclaceae bacterium]|jgi:hypothetical protein|nr:DUF721 domain-containing protein [Rhodocyclaceae bacterium]MBK6908207.1 DUF721 domain-containing protein [Rhodocyclaceae bacterium]
MAARSLYEHIASDSGIGRYTAHAQRLLRYQRYLEAALPPALRPHARVANLKADKLVVYARNAAVAAKLRQFAPRLAGVFASEGVKINEIDVRVQVGDSPLPDKKGNIAKTLPGTAQREALFRLAEELPEGSALQHAVRRLLSSFKAPRSGTS